MLGRYAFRELGANLMLETYRGLIIVNFLIQRKHSLFETVDWKTIPWKIKGTSLGSLLQDLFCDVPGLMEDADAIMARSALGEDIGGMGEALYERISDSTQQACELRWQWEEDDANARIYISSLGHADFSER
ncbi:hypothetical protein V8C37DRAFT_391864 [Trichoderma ceciliae]